MPLMMPSGKSKSCWKHWFNFCILSLKGNEMKSLSEKIAVMQAFERGEKIECAEVHTKGYSDVTIPLWNWDSFDYRVKPKEPTKKYMVVGVDAESKYFHHCDGVWSEPGHLPSSFGGPSGTEYKTIAELELVFDAHDQSKLLAVNILPK